MAESENETLSAPKPPENRSGTARGAEPGGGGGATPTSGGQPAGAAAGGGSAAAAAEPGGAGGAKPPAGGKPAGKDAGAAALELPPPATGWTAGLREITTTIIALSVVGLTLWMLGMTFASANTLDLMKDVMLYALPILGSVIGYYFGRVPAERRAESAEQNRDRAQATASDAAKTATEAQRKAEEETRAAEEASKKLGRAKAAIVSAKEKLQPGAGAVRRTLGGAGGGGAADGTLEAYIELETALRQL